MKKVVRGVFVALGYEIWKKAPPWTAASLRLGHETLAQNKALLEKSIGYDPELIHDHRGRFGEILQEQAENTGSIALLRLDGDRYFGTRVRLEHLYGLVAVGGYCHRRFCLLRKPAVTVA